MSVYVIAQLSIHDHLRYSRYVESFAATLRPFRGRVLAADPDPELLEGSAAPDKVVVLEFSSREEAGRWASSDAYQAIATDRRAAADCLVLVVRAVPTKSPLEERSDASSSPNVPARAELVLTSRHHGRHGGDSGDDRATPPRADR